jgi:hypothetical protein
MPQLTVVHLVWHNLGLEPFRRFIESYRRHPAGIEHELVLVFKEFPDDALHEPYYELAASLPYVPLSMPGTWLDIPAYFAMADHLEQSVHLCCLNSNSEILAPNWLALLHQHLTAPSANAGVVGCTGSWESLYNYARNELLPFTVASATPPPDPATIEQQLRPWAEAFDPFPNPHLRTNAFLVRRDLFRGVADRPGNEKVECWKFESGRRGFTRQLLARGLRPLVVGRDGAAFDVDHWPDSRTYRVGQQPNLMVADNQTRDYQNNEPARRSHLSLVAWGRDLSASPKAE